MSEICLINTTDWDYNIEEKDEYPEFDEMDSALLQIENGIDIEYSILQKRS